MMEGRDPFYLIVARIRDKEALPEIERILDIWELRTVPEGGKCFYVIREWDH